MSCQMPQGHPSHCGCQQMPNANQAFGKMASRSNEAFNSLVTVTRSFTKQEPARCGVTNEVIDFDRYIVVKRDDIKLLSEHKQRILLDLHNQIVDARRAAGFVGKRKRVVISESMDCFVGAVSLVTDELRQKTGVVVQDRLIRTPSNDDLLLVAITFLGSRVHHNTDEKKYGNAAFLIPNTEGNFRDGELIPWNPWNNPRQALELSVLIRARLGCDVNGPCVEYWDEPLTDNEADGHPNGEIMRTISTMQHEESGFSLAFARKVTQVAVYRAHRIQGTV